MHLYTQEEVAQFLKIPPTDLEALVRAHKIAFVEVGGEIRFRCDHIVKFIREHTRQAQSEWLLGRITA